MRTLEQPIDLGCYRVKRQVLACVIDPEYGFTSYEDGTSDLVIDVRLPRSVNQGQVCVWIASMRLVVRDCDGKPVFDAEQLPCVTPRGPSGGDREFSIMFGRLPTEVMRRSGWTMSIEASKEQGGVLCRRPLPLSSDHA